MGPSFGAGFAAAACVATAAPAAIAGAHVAAVFCETVSPVALVAGRRGGTAASETTMSRFTRYC